MLVGNMPLPEERVHSIVLDAEMRKKLVEGMSAGLLLDTAAAVNGLPLHVVADEVARDDGLRQELEKAEAEFETKHLKKVCDAKEGATAWRASVWLLERRFPFRYESRPAGAITSVQLRAVLNSFTDTLTEAIPDVEVRAGALAKLEQAVRAVCGGSPEALDVPSR
jgi:hypothetical protein